MSDKLAPFSDVTEIERSIPEVRTLARPTAIPLIAARNEVQRNLTLQRLFKQSREEQWDAAKLAAAIEPELSDRLDDGTPGQAHEVAVYLADEYTQIGNTLLIVSSTTGKAIAQISEDDIWQPPPVPRESGGMATPLPRLRPDLHGFLVQWVFDEEREKRTIADLATRVNQTELLHVEGDRRLWPATKVGRANLTQHLNDRLPTLLQATQGNARVFLDKFEVRMEPSNWSNLEPLIKCTAVSRSVTHIADSLAMNLRYDPLTALGAQVATGWVRDIALSLALAAKDKAYAMVKIEYDRVTHTELFDTDFWLGDPRSLVHVQPLVPSSLPVVDAPLTGLRQGAVGAIVLDPSSYECRSRELFDRWEVVAVVEYTLYVNWVQVMSMELLNLPQEAHAELVR